VTTTEFLSPMALDFLWESLGVGELPYPLDVRSHGHTVDERTALRNQVWGELRARDLLDRNGRVEPHLEDWLTLLARADRSIDSVFQVESGTPARLALAVADDRVGLLATQTDDGLRLRAIDPDALASSVVELLPPAKRGTEQSVTLPREDLAELDKGRPAGRTETDRQVLRRLSDQPKLRAGQLAVNARRRMGGRSRSPVLSWFDAESGRYLTYAKRGSDGHEWVTIAPADAATLRHRLGELLGSLT
jgi:ESX secretion-associated protein EspG